MPAAFEEMLAYLLAQLNEPVEQQVDQDGAIAITSGDPGEVIVRLTDEEVTVAEYSMASNTSSRAVVKPIVIGAVRWNVISADAAMRAVKALMVAACEARLFKFRVCSSCERSIHARLSLKQQYRVVR